MKITYYSKYSALGPSSRYRAFQFQDLFRSHGFDFQISELFNDHYFDILRAASEPAVLSKIPYTLSRFQKRKKMLKRDQSDLAIIEQQLFPYLPFAVERRYLPDRYLLEFDDAIYLTHPLKMPRMIERAAGVIAGNETLAEYARRFNSRVDVVPTVLNTDKFEPSPKRQQDKIVVGWCGLEYNYPYLKTISAALRNVCSRPDVELCILSGAPPKGLDVPYRFVKWDSNREVQQLNEFDIGLMPLIQNEWCKGKCGFKLLQYMSMEIPSIATPIGVNENIVQHGVNGFLADTSEDWERHLALLVDNAGLRKELGKAARSTVVSQYSTGMWFPRLAAIYRSHAE